MVHVVGKEFVDVAYHARNRDRVVEETVALERFGVDRKFLHLGLGRALCGAGRLFGDDGGNLVVVQLLLQQGGHVGEALADAFLLAGIPFGQDFVCQRVDSAGKLAQVHFGTFDNRIFRGHKNSIVANSGAKIAFFGLSVALPFSMNKKRASATVEHSKLLH